MRLVVGLLDPLGGHVRVHLRCREIRVLQHLLHASQVCPSIKHVRGVAVAQLVRREGRIQSAAGELFFQPQLNQARIDGAAFFL